MTTYIIISIWNTPFNFNKGELAVNYSFYRWMCTFNQNNR